MKKVEFKVCQCIISIELFNLKVVLKQGCNKSMDKKKMEWNKFAL